MNNLRNRVQLIGNLGADPEIKQTGSGRKLAKFSMATSDNYKNNKGEWVENTQWHRLEAWGKVAEIVERFLRKGSEVAIEGRLNHSSYEDQQGVKRYYTDIVVNEIVLLRTGKAMAEQEA